jgi:hypothetical protein
MAANGISTLTIPSGPQITTYNVTNSGSGAYVILSTNNPTITLVRGITYYFAVAAPGHPFWINSVSGTGTENAYSSGVTNNGIDNSTVIFIVPLNAPNTLYYNCQFHGSMAGTFDIINLAEFGGSGGEADKQARQIAKLDIAQAKRQGKTVTANGTITGSIDATKSHYRTRNIYNLTLLPDTYATAGDDNANVDGLVVGRPWLLSPTIGSDNPANAAEPDATAWLLMDGPWYNTPGNPNSGFIGGQSWRKMAPIGYFPYGRETYVYGDEVVRFDGTWRYENSGLGIISTGGTEGQYPWQATWNGSFTAAKITGTYVKTTNYPAVP